MKKSIHTLFIRILLFGIASLLVLPGCTAAEPSSQSGGLLGGAPSRADIAVQDYNNIPQSNGLLQSESSITYVGLGYNVLERAYMTPDGFSPGRPIFNTEEVAARLKTAASTVNSSKMIMGTTVSEYSEQLKSKLSISSDYPMFSGSISGEFDMTQTQKKNVHFIKSMSGYIKNSEYIDVTNDLKDILNASFQQDLNSDLSPKDLFDRYGTHVLVEALMGARCTYNYTYSSVESESTTDIQAKVEATYRYISGSASAEEQTTAKTFLSNTYFQSLLMGGPDIDASTLTNLLKNFPTWVAGLKDSVPTIYGISNMNSMIPIWTFADDPTRAAELESYYKQRGGDIQKILDNMSEIPPEPSTKTYIESVIITSSKNKNTAQDGTSYPGYTMINKDLNKDAGGNFIYLWYKTTTDPDKALRDIRFTYDDFNDIPSFYTKNAHDLNEGAGGAYIYLWTTKRSTIGAPISDIQIFFGKNADMPSGYNAANANYYNHGKNTHERAELNHGAGGYYIYLGFSTQ